jgi:GDP-L-fucose synthase
MQPEVIIWGSGKPLREFLHADDLANACYFLMQHYNEPGLINIGMGNDISIYDLALLVKEIVGYEGKIMADSSKPDGTPRKLMDISKLSTLGWKATISLEDGIRQVYNEYFMPQVQKGQIVKQ